MEQGGITPLIDEAVSVEPKTVSRWRWWVHLILLGILPLLVGVMGMSKHRTRAVLPDTASELIQISLVELGFFGVIFAVAWLFSRANRTQLFLPWRRGLLPLVLGFAYSIALRLIIMMILIVFIVFWLALTRGEGKGAEHLQPKIAELIDPKALTQSPAYLILCLTLISFVVAGLREELWRAGMLAGIQALFPQLFNRWPGRIGAVVIVAILFGLGHTVQGPAGVVMTGLLGVGLGVIIVWHRSIWEAVITHGFFDATTFAALYLVVKHFPGKLPGF